MTVNSFSSVSLDPPLVLWSLAKSSSSYADFTKVTHFAVNVLAADQHHLSRNFHRRCRPVMRCRMRGEARKDVPCSTERPRTSFAASVRQFDGGDHVIFLGEVEDYNWQEGEPLVFHSGRYHVTTRHPDLPE